MATTEQLHTATGTASTEYSFPFPYFKEGDVEVTVDNVIQTQTTKYTFPTATAIKFTAGNIPTAGKSIKIYRNTDVDNLKAVFSAGSSIRASDLNNNLDLVLYGEQDKVITSKISNDAVTSAKLDTNIDIAGTFDVTGATTLDSTLNVAGATVMDTTLNTKGNVDFDANLNVDGTLTVDGISTLTGAVSAPGGVTGDLTGTASLATSITATSNNSNNETVYPTFVDGVSGTQGIETDSGLTYNPSTGVLTTTSVTGNLTGNVTGDVTGDVTGNITGSVTGNADTATDLAAAAKITNSEQSGHTANDTTYYTTAASDARYYNIGSTEEIVSSESWVSDDTSIATTKAVDNRVINLVDEVGGFVPIADESDFPATNPDINSAAGTIVSVGTLTTSYTPSTGTVTIPASTLDNLSNDLTITGCGSTVLAAGFGVLVETKALSDAAYAANPSYTFHRLTPKSSEVTTVAGISGNVTTVAGISSNVTTVAGNTTNINTVAGNNSNITAVAGNSTNINAVAGNETNIDAVAGNATNINTVASNNTNVTNVGGSIANVNTVASNISNVNNFADLYQIDDFSPSAPTTDGGGNAIAEGDLAYDSTAQQLKVYSGSAWEAGVAAPSTLMPKAGGTFTGDVTFDNGTNAGKDMFWDESDDTLKLNDDVQLSLGSDRDMRFYHTGTHGYLNVVTGNLNIRTNGTEEAIVAKKDGAVELYHDGSQKISTTSGGIDVTGTTTDDGADHAGDVIFQGDGANSYWDKSNDSLIFNDNAGVNLGTGRDVRFYFDGNHTYLNVVDGNLNIRTNGTESAIVCTKDAGVAAYYDASEKFKTTNTGVDITGNIVVSGTVDGIDIATDVAANTAKVTNATHTGEVTGATALTIADDVVDEANLKVDNSPTNDYVLTAKSSAAGGLTWAAAASGTPEGTAILSTGETGTAKFLRVDGDNSCSWQVPPDTNTTYSVVDSSADGLAPQLPGSHGGKFLKADGTWEVPPDTNTTYTVGDGGLTTNDFTNTLKTKLDNIEASADVTDATNVNAAGAVMESDVDAKGDIFAGTADNTVSRLAVGTNGYVLKADSSTSTGLAWGAASAGTITALNNQAANRLTTIGSTTTQLDGEANLTFEDTVSTGLISGKQITGRGFECPATVSDDWTIAAGNNAFFPGPMTVASGKTVTVPANRTLTVV